MSPDQQPDDTEEPDPLQNPDGSRKPDLRYTDHERGTVRVDRQLDGSGHLARGDRTRMSVLNFSARAQARTERDPDFAFRPAPTAGRPAPAEATPAAPVAEPVPGMSSDGAEVPEDSLLGKIKKILGF